MHAGNANTSISTETPAFYITWASSVILSVILVDTSKNFETTLN